ncbi:methyl-accepting chemotaxis protein [Niameybacter massiliensis]|uniref:Methyl-accepting chemotaxis protein n=1 Tax=Holtiella tumoricola TaxID=3018743 RepID=A0AA42DRV6_9FIRM|nr:methyl-accepting chemotaxis protein [Holtiella tumoricola]MDA3733975.1 methyl-accepting chemotaxis protein [Holtiella tumoricola]
MKNSIQFKLLANILVITLAIILVMYFSLSSILKTVLKESNLEHIQTLSTCARDQIELYTTNNLNIVDAIANNSILVDLQTTMNEKQNFLRNSASKYGATQIGLVNSSGLLSFPDQTTQDIKDTVYYQNLMHGKSEVFGPYYTDDQSEFLIGFTAPVIQNGRVTGGVILYKNGLDLSQFISQFNFGQNGHAYILNTEGMLIASSKNTLDEQEVSIEDRTLLHQEILDNKLGTTTYSSSDGELCLSYLNVPSTGWSIVLESLESDLFANMYRILNTLLIISIIAILLAVLGSSFIARSLSKRLSTFKQTFEQLATGDFCIELNQKELQQKDEIGALYQALNQFMHSMQDMLLAVKESSATLSSHSDDLLKTSSALLHSSEYINDTSQDIAHGTTLQNNDLVIVNQLVENVNEHIQEVHLSLDNITTFIQEVNHSTSISTADMEKLSTSLINFNAIFSNLSEGIMSMNTKMYAITDITHIINGISEQTNLLALNAAIEAARAGESGRGFSIVATEIRKLAEQSKLAAQNINHVIKDVIGENQNIISSNEDLAHELNAQKEHVYNTLASFQTIISGVEEITPKITVISGKTTRLNNEKEKLYRNIKNITTTSIKIASKADDAYTETTCLQDASQQINETASHLTYLTEHLGNKMKQFKLNH